MGKTKSTARTARQNQPRGIAGNMEELINRFGTEEDCELHLLSLRWPGGFVCPHCGGRAYARVANRREFRCAACSWQFSATSGTLIAHTKVPLTKWFRAAFLVCRDPRGASAQGVARECGVSDATGVKMVRRLRAAMGFAMRLCKVGGDWVEVDAANVTCGNTDGAMKAGTGLRDMPVMVAASGSSACLRAVADVTAGSIEEFCSAHVSRVCEVRLDAHPSHFSALAGGWRATMRESAAHGDSPDSLPTAHHVISNLKAKLNGTCHGVTAGRLQEHCDEFGWKYGHRHGDQFADLLKELARWPHVNLSEINEVARWQPPHGSVRDAARGHNRRLRDKMFNRVRQDLITVIALVANLAKQSLTDV